MTALDLRRHMATNLLTEAEYRAILHQLSESERKSFFASYVNQNIHDTESFIAWIKKVGGHK